MRILVIFLCIASSLAAEPPEWRQLWGMDLWENWHKKPISELRKLADKNSSVAMFVLAKKLKDQRTPASREEGKQWMKKAAERGLPQAILEADWPESTSSASPESILEQFKILERAAATGFPPAQIRVAGFLVHGPPIRPDFKRALALVRDSYDQGATASYYTLAMLYSRGIGEPRSEKENPIDLLQEGARVSDAQAMEQLIYRFHFGLGVEKNALAEAAYRAQHFAKYGRQPFVMEFEEISYGLNKEVNDVFKRAMLEQSRADLMKLAEMHQAGNWGAVNSVRAAALYTIARADREAVALQKNFSTAEKTEFEREVKWLNSFSK
jgi:TPR repeat protein